MLAEIVALGKELGYEGPDLTEFVKEQQDKYREDRAKERERIKEEKEKLELELKLASVKQGGNSSASEENKGENVKFRSDQPATLHPQGRCCGSI